MVGWGRKENKLWGRKENKWWGSGVFSLSPSKSFLPKMKRKLKCENETASWRNFFCPIPFFFFFKFISWAIGVIVVVVVVVVFFFFFFLFVTFLF